MIGRILYWKAKRWGRGAFDAYLVRARDKHAWRGVVAGETDLPWWLRAARGPLARNDVRILVGHPPQTLLLIDAVEAEAQRPIRDAWPSLRAYLHRGVDFAPYAATFRKRLGEGVAFIRDGEIDDSGDLNAFGERLTKEQMDAAVDAAQGGCGGQVRSYRVEAEFPTVDQSRGRHVFQIECVTPPPDLSAFAAAIDRALPHPVRDVLRSPIVRLVAAGSLADEVAE